MAYKEQRLTWTKVKPDKSGWYWMLNPYEQPGLPMIVQIERDWKSGCFVALVPASLYPKVPSTVLDPQDIDALWAGPLTIPSVARDNHNRLSLRWKVDGNADIAA